MLQFGISISIIITRGRLGFPGGRIALRKHTKTECHLFLFFSENMPIFFFFSFYYFPPFGKGEGEKDRSGLRRGPFEGWHNKEGEARGDGSHGTERFFFFYCMRTSR